MLGKEKCFLVDIPKEDYQNYYERRICLGSVLGFFVGFYQLFSLMNPREHWLVKASYLGGKNYGCFSF